MRATKAIVWIYVKLANGSSRFVKPVSVANGRFKPLYAVVNGKPEHHPEGVYFLRYSDRGKRVWEKIGPDHNLVGLAKKRRDNILMSRQLGVEVVGDVPEGETPRVTVQSAIDEYVEEIRARRSKGTYQHYSTTLLLFADSLLNGDPLRPASKRSLEELDRKDILHFMSFLKEQENNAPRTVFNRVGYLKTFLKQYGVVDLLPKKDRPKYTEKAVAAYTEEELRVLLAATSPRNRLLFEFFLWSGARDQEVACSCWSDINFSAGTFHVCEKVDLGFKPKDHEERTIPLPDNLNP